MLNMDSFKCTIVLTLLFMLLTVGIGVMELSRAASSPWQMSDVVWVALGSTVSNTITAFITGAIAWLCGRKTITFPAMCNVAAGSRLIFQVIAGLTALVTGPSNPYLFR